MVTLKYIGQADFASSGINFIPHFDYVLKPEVADYLVKNFVGYFTVIEEPKVEVKAKATTNK